MRARILQTGFFGRCDAGRDKVLDAVGRLEMRLAQRQQGDLGRQNRLCAGKALHGKHGDVAACLGVTLGACLDEVGCKELVVGRGRGEVEDAVPQFRGGECLAIVEDRGGVDVQIPEDVGVLERTVGIGEGHDVGVAGNRTRARHLRFLLGGPCLVIGRGVQELTERGGLVFADAPREDDPGGASCGDGLGRACKGTAAIVAQHGLEVGCVVGSDVEDLEVLLVLHLERVEGILVESHAGLGGEDDAHHRLLDGLSLGLEDERELVLANLRDVGSDSLGEAAFYQACEGVCELFARLEACVACVAIQKVDGPVEHCLLVADKVRALAPRVQDVADDLDVLKEPAVAIIGHDGRVFVVAVEVKRLRRETDDMCAGKGAELEGVVLAQAQLRVEAQIVVDEQGASIQLVAHEGVAADLAEQRIDGVAGVGRGALGKTVVSPEADGEGLAAEHDDVGAVALGNLVEQLTRVMANKVIGVHEQDVGAAGKLKAMVAGGRNAGVCLVDGFDARVGAGGLVNHGGGAIGRAVVDADNLDVAQRLLQKAVQAFLEVPLGVVDGYDDRYGGAGCHRALLLANNG